MNFEGFKATYITVFLATWAANNYDRCCSYGTQEQLHHPPVEDAEFLAKKAWEELSEKVISI